MRVGPLLERQTEYVSPLSSWRLSNSGLLCLVSVEVLKVFPFQKIRKEQFFVTVRNVGIICHLLALLTRRFKDLERSS